MEWIILHLYTWKFANWHSSSVYELHIILLSVKASSHSNSIWRTITADLSKPGGTVINDVLGSCIMAWYPQCALGERHTLPVIQIQLRVCGDGVSQYYQSGLEQFVEKLPLAPISKTSCSEVSIITLDPNVAAIQTNKRYPNALMTLLSKRLNFFKKFSLLLLSATGDPKMTTAVRAHYGR